MESISSTFYMYNLLVILLAQVFQKDLRFVGYCSQNSTKYETSIVEDPIDFNAYF